MSSIRPFLLLPPHLLSVANFDCGGSGIMADRMGLRLLQERACGGATQGALATKRSACRLIAGDRRAIGCMGATEFAPKIVSDTRPMS
jgi:hypothetical protein